MPRHATSGQQLDRISSTPAGATHINSVKAKEDDQLVGMSPVGVRRGREWLTTQEAGESTSLSGMGQARTRRGEHGESFQMMPYFTPTSSCGVHMATRRSPLFQIRRWNCLTLFKENAVSRRRPRRKVSRVARKKVEAPKADRSTIEAAGEDAQLDRRC